MKKTILIMFSFLTMTLQAQQTKTKNESETLVTKSFKVKKNTGKLQLNLGQAQIEGYDGNEIVFSLEGKPEKEDERAKGLKAINSMGLEDNTGLGISVVDKNGTVEVNQIKNVDSENVKILVPKGMVVSINYQSQFGNDFSLKNLENELEISVVFNSIKIENCTGPATIKTLHGDVDVVFNKNMKSPISIVSIYGHVDTTLPKDVKANIKMNTSYGDILIAPELNIDFDKQNDLTQYNNQLSGKINGGGINVSLKADHDKIYLRAK